MPKNMDIRGKRAASGAVTSNARTKGPDMTSTERQRRYKANMERIGCVQLNIWIPAAAVAEFQRAAELAREYPNLTVARMGDRVSGRIVGLK